MSVFSSLYDSVNGSAYQPYADFLEKSFKKADIPVNEVLDLGCGTGGITAALADRGFDMTGADISEDMLSVAFQRNIGKNILLLCQDMRSFELYGTVQAVYSSFDCLNYITDENDLKKVFSLVRNYLEPGGVFVFDVNTLYRYENVFDGKSYVYENGKDILVWRSAFDRETMMCEFRLDGFSKRNGNLYERESDIQVQKCHSQKEITDAAVGFSLVSKEKGKGFDGCSEEEKTYYIFKRI